jgi:hypothetical protein
MYLNRELDFVVSSRFPFVISFLSNVAIKIILLYRSGQQMCGNI